MPVAEVIFEDGSNSMLYYEDEEEAKSFLTAHHQRALDGLPGAAQDQVERTDISPEDFTNMPPIEFMKSRPAVRIYKVLTYEEHPGDAYETGQLDSKSVSALVDGMTSKDGTIDANQLVGALRDESSPVYPVDQGHRESQWKADGTEMDLSFLPTEPTEPTAA
jgi:hypothetical protein